MTYEVRIGQAARKELAAVHRDGLTALLDRVGDLARDPRPSGATPLRGSLVGLYRLRVGALRIAYCID